jgi:hypothetical protein
MYKEIVDKTFWNSSRANEQATKLELFYVMYRKAMSVGTTVAKYAFPPPLCCLR